VLKIFFADVRFEENLQGLYHLLRLRNIASGELQDSIFITSCWQQACEMLNNQ
jgi:hypothetical protein